MHEFEAGWIDKFIQVVHQHRDRIGTKSLRDNIADYVKELKASTVKIDFEYPFFIEKRTPVPKEKCLVKYSCGYSPKSRRSTRNRESSSRWRSPASPPIQCPIPRRREGYSAN